MKTTLSVIKADIGSIAGHVKPSEAVIATVRSTVADKANKVLLDFKIFHTGDDIAILMSHQHGVLAEEVHRLAWDAFIAGTKVAKEQGLYGAGQDLLKDAFSGNVKGMGPAVCEMEIEERTAEPFVLFMADKTDPGVFNAPFYGAFADPFHNSGLILSPKMETGFRFKIMDVNYTEADKIIELSTPNEIYDIACLLRDLERYIVESVWSNTAGTQAAVVSTTRLHNIAGTYTGKDDPVALIRCQGEFPATGEILSPYALTPNVAGFMRGSHVGPLMPCKLGTTISFFDGPPVITAAGLCVHNGIFTETVDLFDHPFWDYIRNEASREAMDIREQGFFGSSMLGMNELEYGGIVEKLKKLEKKFQIIKK